MTRFTGAHMRHGSRCVNTLKSEQNGRYFADDILNAFSSFKIVVFRTKFHDSLFSGFQLITTIYSDNGLVPGCRTGDKPLSEPMAVLFIDAHMCRLASES